MIVTEVAQRGFAGSVVIALPSAGSAPLVSFAFINRPLFFDVRGLEYLLGAGIGYWGARIEYWGPWSSLQPKGTRRWCRPGVGRCPGLIKFIPDILV